VIVDVPNGTCMATASVMMPVRRGVPGIASVASGNYFSWSSTSGGATEQSPEIVVNGADIGGVRLVARRPTTR
jgi:hypothetical protein